jgi:hypothetical protein
MIVNFRTRGINRCAHKLTWTFTLIKKKNEPYLSIKSPYIFLNHRNFHWFQFI